MRAGWLWFVIALAAGGSPASADELTPAEIGAARSIYVAKCAKCHEFYEPRNYSEADWRKWMGKMNRKSKLKREQADLLGRYLDSYRAGQIAGKAEGEAKPAQKTKPPKADSR